MTQSKHPITLEKVFFTRSIVISVPDYQPVDGPLSIPPENTIDISPLEGQPGHYMASMRMFMNQNGDPAAPYIIDMECIGLFTADEKLTQEEATRGVMITAHSVLYGAIREAVSWITGRQPHAQLMLGLSVLQPKQPET